METAEPAQGGPRYAPHDPTLPKPWKGLIDGSSGVLYYWNPETNITQYEKPAALTPPLPLGPPPTSKPASLPVTQTQHPNGLLAQQMTQSPQQQGQQLNQQQIYHQQGSQILQTGQQHGSQLAQATQQQGMQPPMQHQFSQHFSQHPGQHMPQQQGQHTGQPALQHQGSQLAQLGHPYASQHMQYMLYPQTMPPQGQQQNSHQSTQNSSQAPLMNKQEYGEYPKREETDYQHVNQYGFSPSQNQQTGATYAQNLPVGINSNQKASQPGQGPQFSGSSVMPHPTGAPQIPQTGTDFSHPQHVPQFQNQMGPPMVHAQHANGPSVGLKMEYEENSSGRPGHDFRFNPHVDAPNMIPQHPKLASIPIARNQQEMRMDGLPHQNAALVHGGGLNSVAGQGIHKMYQASSSPAFPNNAPMKPPSLDASNLSSADAYRKQHEVTVSGDNVPAPFMTFEATGFPPQILREIQLAGFPSPTPIQAQTWPISVQGRDIVAIAKTGSGKTLGYLIPIFIHLSQRRNNSQNGPTVLVLAPTRELATQIQDEAIKFGRSSRFACTCLYGGAPKGPQLKELERGADIVVATPGRLNDILEMKKIDFRQVSLLVLDEADRMLDMGFEPQIRTIVNAIPPRRQTLMFTATWPKEVRKIANDLLINPVQVNIGRVDELAANKSITQHVELVPQMEKQRRVEQILRSQERGSKIIIFCSTKRLCDQLARSFGRNFGAAAIHGDKNQTERDFVLNEFRSGKSPILVATDVAARGLDIKDIRVVINYDFPTGVEDYVHRIGRTGRAGATGVAYTFFSDQDWKHAADLVKLLEGANQHVPPEVRDMALRGGSSFGRDRGGMNRFDSGTGGGGDGGSRWDSGGRGGMRDGGFGGRSGMMDSGFGGRGGMRDGGFGGRGGTMDGGFGGRGGMRDTGFGGRGGMRDGGFGGRGSMRDGGFGGRGFSSPGAGYGRNEPRSNDRYNSMDDRGRGQGRGRGRLDNRRGNTDRSRGRSYSRSRSRSYSRSRSRSWSRSRSRSFSRSWSRSPSPRPSRNEDRNKRRRVSGFDKMEPIGSESQLPLHSVVSDTLGAEIAGQPQLVLNTELGHAEAGSDLINVPAAENLNQFQE